MASSQNLVPSSSTVLPEENGSIIKGKGFGPRGSSDDESTPLAIDPTRPRGAPSHRRVSDPEIRSSSPSLEFEKLRTEKRLSQVVPRRQKGKEILKEDRPWEVKNILSFDGGGIRGLYSLLMLKQLMDQIKFIEDIYVDGEGKNAPATSSFHPETQLPNASHNNDDDHGKDSEGVFLPCHYFDYICGTSTGGLIAIMLGRLRMTVDDCIYEYEQLAGSVFGHAHHVHQMVVPLSWYKRPKYDTKVLEDVIRGVITTRGEVCTDRARRTLKTGRELCKVFVFAYRQEGHDDTRGPTWEAPYIFRSYDHWSRVASPSLRNPGAASDYPLWRVARATAAAPLYFAPMQMYLDDEVPQPKPGLIKRTTSFFEPKPKKTNAVTFIDGGFGPANNPSMEAWAEVSSSNEGIGTFVSIGTGRGRVNRFHTTVLRFIKAGIAAVGDPEPPHQEMKKKAAELGFGYYRFDEFDGLPDLDFDEWKPRKSGRHTMDKIQRAYSRWIAEPKVQESFRKCAVELVRRRRLRTADESQWERYAVKAFFDCGEDRCPVKVEKQWYNRSEFREHLMNDHDLVSGLELNEAIRRDKKTWRYKAPER